MWLFIIRLYKFEKYYNNHNIYYKMNNIDINVRNDLCLYMAFHRSDKSIWHNYTLVYNELFKNRRNDNIRLFELGLGTLNNTIVSHMTPGFQPLGSLLGW